MMQDVHRIFDFVQKKRSEEWNDAAPLIIMGRSLGSASALELAFYHPEQIDGLIIESGFAYAAPLLRPDEDFM